MKKQILSVIALLTLIVSACSPLEQRALDQNRALWESQEISHYRFELTVACFCIFSDRMPLTVEVRDGFVVSMTGVNGEDVEEFRGFLSGFDTMEKLFATIDEAIGMDARTLEVEYDPTYGYPVSIYVDPEELVADDEIGYYVANFQVLP